MLGGSNAFIEANCRLHAGLQHGVVVDVVPGQRLFDVVQSETIERQHHLHVGECIGAVGIDREMRVRKCVAHRLHQLHVVAGHDLELDALVAEV